MKKMILFLVFVLMGISLLAQVPPNPVRCPSIIEPTTHGILPETWYDIQVAVDNPTDATLIVDNIAVSPIGQLTVLSPPDCWNPGRPAGANPNFGLSMWYSAPPPGIWKVKGVATVYFRLVKPGCPDSFATITWSSLKIWPH